MKKLCSECTHSINFHYDFHCVHPKNIEHRTKNIDGFPTTSWKAESCMIHRTASWWTALLMGYCGKAGRWYEEDLT